MTRRTTAVLLTGLLLAAVLFAVVAPSRADVRTPVTFANARRPGIRALGLYLERRGWRLHHEVTAADLIAPAEGVLLMPPEVSQELSESEEQALLQWVAAGGRLVKFGRSQPNSFFASALYKGEQLSRPQVRPVTPSGHFPGIEKLGLTYQRFYVVPDDWDVALRDSLGAIVLARRYGDGAMLQLPDPMPLSNRGLPVADNLAFALQLIAEPGRSEVGVLMRDVAIVAEEVREIRAEAALPWSWRLAGISVGLAGIAAFWLIGRRTGPIMPPEPPPPRPLTEYVTAQAHAYRRAGAGGAVLEFLAAALRRELAQATGLPPGAPTATLAHAAERLGLRPDEVESVLVRLEAGGNPHPRDVQKLAAAVAALQRRIRRVH